MPVGSGVERAQGQQPPPVLPQGQGVHGQAPAQGLLNGQPVQQVPPPANPVPPQVQRPRGQAVSVVQGVMPRPLGVEQQNQARAILPTADDLKKQVGTDPKANSKLLGFIPVVQSSHYKAVLEQLDKTNEVLGRCNTVVARGHAQLTPAIRNEIGLAREALGALDASLLKYGEGRKTGHKEEMARFRDQVQQQLQRLDDLDQQLARGTIWPPELSVNLALQYLRANPAITLQEMGFAAQNHLSEQDVAAYAKSGVPLKPGALPGGGQFVGPLSVLGSGATATVYKGQFQLANGQQFQGVFKAEAPPKVPPPASLFIGIDKDMPNYALRSVATFKLDQKLGFGLVPPTELVLHEGKLGTVMGMAQGKSPLVDGDWTYPLSPQELQVVRNNPGALKQLAAHYGWKEMRLENDQVRVVNSHQQPNVDENNKMYMETVKQDTVLDIDMTDPVLRMELTRLQWLDALTGQVDRHGHNYFVNKGLDGHLHVTAIDNDLSFGKNTVHADQVNNAPTRESGARRPDPGGMALKGGKLPQVVDRQTYTALMHLTNQDLQAELGGLLTPEEVQATESRLNDIQLHLAHLARTGRVVDDVQDWSGPDVSTLLGVPKFNQVDAIIRNSHENFSIHMADLKDVLDRVSDSGYVARESLEIHLAKTQPTYKITAKLEQMQ